MMINPENTALRGKTFAATAKKAWNNGPELVLISSNEVNAKSHPNAHESTASIFIKSGVPFVTNNASYSFQGTINQAVS
ncbi:hypothetical protein BEL04_10795 [Mucilaginibacter sp. PPCGB 2223]|uniref:hypothetical protein n=1 Tax=Mucilaginibacter sp. PPCGB 2223 TaxID=1886027 RepID=UPI000824C01C|nr:hypothetical protein [Mucilaginibacter sp. PPCGB 2223]OCX54703.1 hypothetical protein BEL04_10795 [Mucilaginibacter sp. PPCGB 2223]